mgnify:CR=1 FL=1
MSRIDHLALAKAMSRAPMTVSQLAAATGISVSYASDICNGHRQLARSPHLRKAIAKALDVPQHWIEA